MLGDHTATHRVAMQVEDGPEGEGEQGHPGWHADKVSAEAQSCTRHHSMQVRGPGPGGAPGVDQAVVQQLACVVQAVPDVTQHHSEGLSHRDGVPEVSIVLALALLS